MTKEITKAYILQQIENKFKLRDLEPARFEFSETVHPVYSVEPHLRKPIISSVTKSITGTGGVLFFPVPPNEKWFVNGYTVVPMGAGAFTMAGLYVTRYTVPIVNMVYLDLTAGQTAAYTNYLPKTLELYSTDSLRMNIDGYTSTQDLQIYLDYEVEEIR